MKDSNIEKNKIDEVMQTAFNSIRSLVDVDVVVGKTIYANDMMILPLTKVAMGFVSGGGEYYSDMKELKKEIQYPFSGGSGAGLSIQPIAFLVIDGKSVELIKVEQKSAFDKLVEAVPEVAKFITENFKSKKKWKEEII